MQAMHTQMAMLTAKNTSLEIEKNRLQTQLYQQQRLHLQGSFPCGNGKMQALYGDSDFQKLLDEKNKLQEENEKLQQELETNRFFMDQLKEVISELQNQNRVLLNDKKDLQQELEICRDKHRHDVKVLAKQKDRLKEQVEELHKENNKRQRMDAAVEKDISKKISKQLSLK